MHAGESTPAIGDAFGQMLTRCWAAGVPENAVHEVIERDDGFIGIADAAAYFGGRDQWPRPEQWGGDRVSGRVLDVGCGAGRHGVPLAEAGHEVLGVDTSAGAVAVARERGLRAIEASASHLPAGIGRFDTVLMLGNNLGLLGSRSGAATLLGQLADVTVPGGRLIGSSRDPHGLFQDDHLPYLRDNLRAGRMPGEVRLRVRHGFESTDWFPYLYVSAAELRDLLVGTPWTLDEVRADGVDLCVVLTRQPAPDGAVG